VTVPAFKPSYSHSKGSRIQLDVHLSQKHRNVHISLLHIFENRNTWSLIGDMPKKSETNIQDLSDALGDIKELAEKSKVELEEWISEHPLESAAFILMAGIVLGVLLGSSASRRD
jgi:hypothetical protein